MNRNSRNQGKIKVKAYLPCEKEITDKKGNALSINKNEPMFTVPKKINNILASAETKINLEN